MKALQLVCPHCGGQVAVMVTAGEAPAARTEPPPAGDGRREDLALSAPQGPQGGQGPSMRERAEPGYSGPPGQPPGPKVEKIAGKWYIECPRHGEHAAREWEAKGRAPACVKCSAADDANKSGYCSVQTPLELAGRWLRWLGQAG